MRTWIFLKARGNAWQKVRKGGVRTAKTFDSIVDIQSLECLLSNLSTKSVVDNMLVPEGGPELNLSNNIREKYCLFIGDDKLTTLSTDFPGRRRVVLPVDGVPDETQTQMWQV